MLRSFVYKKIKKTVTKKLSFKFNLKLLTFKIKYKIKKIEVEILN